MTTMNVLTTVKDGDVIIKVSGGFGPSKTVNLNSFGGQTYIHLRNPTDPGWKTFTMTLGEWGCLAHMLNGDELNKIEEAFKIQVRNFIQIYVYINCQQIPRIVCVNDPRCISSSSNCKQ